jgi:hypothetical protein
LSAADLALSYYRIGARKKAIELARQTALDVIENGKAFESILNKPTYANALGICFGILMHDQNWEETGQLVWQGRCLANGYPIALGYLAVPSIVADVQLIALSETLQAESEFFVH